MAELQGRELDAALARALGWEVDENRMYPVKGDWVICSDYRALPYYSLSLDAMHEVEAEHFRRGKLAREYTKALIEIAVDPFWQDDDFELAYRIHHATAEQKVRAALAVLSAQEAK